MKITLFLSSIWLFLASLFSPAEPTVLTGKISDGKEPLIGASVKVLRNADLVRGAITDLNGEYSLTLDPGTYTVEISYTGFETIRYKDIPIQAGKTNVLNATLTNSVLTEVVIT